MLTGVELERLGESLFIRRRETDHLTGYDNG